MVKQIENEADEISQNATAQSDLIQSRAQASYKATVEGARSTGLQHLYSEIGVTDQKEKASFDYLRTLKGQSNMQLAVNFQQLIAGPVSYDNGNEIIETR